MEVRTLASRATGSVAERLLNCPASISLSIGIKEEEKDYATAGTEAHALGAHALINATPLEDIPDDAVRVYVDTVRTIAENKNYVVEARLPFLGGSGGIDCYVLHGKIAYLFDFKYGVGEKLWAPENPQLAYYSCALYENFPEIRMVHASLVQPRVEGLFEDTPHISSWTLPWQTLRSWTNRFAEAFEEVERARIIKAGKWCKYCPVRAACPVRLAEAEQVERAQRELMEDEPEAFNDYFPALREYYVPAQIDRMARLLYLKKDVMAWFTKAEELLFQLAKGGHAIPGFKLAQRRSSRKWHMMMSEWEIAAELMKRGIEDPYKPRELINLTAAEKLVDLTGLTIKPEGKPCLKPTKDDNGDE